MVEQLYYYVYFNALFLPIGGIDFMGTAETFRFNRFTSNVPQCACISILQDSVVEGREFFEVSLSTFDSRVQLAQNSSLATVIIADDDGTYYGSVLDTDVVKLMAGAKWMERTLHNLSVIVQHRFCLDSLSVEI